MKYCPKCKKLYTQEDTRMCDTCKKSKLISEIKGGDAVRLCQVNAAQREYIIRVLKENEVPCSYENVNQNLGMGFEEFNIFVPYKYAKVAYDICRENGLMAVDEVFEALEEIDVSQIEIEPSEFEQMSPAKRTTVRILSAILFILVVCLVVFGVDFVMEIILNLFK